MNTEKLKSLMINEEGFVFDPRSGHTYNVNATGMLALNCLKAGATVADTIQALVEQFGVDEQSADRDFEAFCNELQRLRLVVAGGMK